MRGQTWGRTTFFHHPPRPQDPGGFTRPEARCFSPWRPKDSVCFRPSRSSHQEIFVALFWNTLISQERVFVYSFPPGLLVEISDGECGCWGLGAAAGWGPRGQELSRSSFWNEQPHADLAEEAAGSPQTAHAARGGAGGALQPGAGEWLHGGRRTKTKICVLRLWYWGHGIIMQVHIVQRHRAKQTTSNFQQLFQTQSCNEHLHSVIDSCCQNTIWTKHRLQMKPEYFSHLLPPRPHLLEYLNPEVGTNLTEHPPSKETFDILSCSHVVNNCSIQIWALTTGTVLPDRHTSRHSLLGLKMSEEEYGARCMFGVVGLQGEVEQHI